MLIKVQRLPDIRAKIPADIVEGLRVLQTNEDHVIAVASLELEDLYRMGAVVSFLSDGDTSAFHNGMYLAAAVRRRFLACVERGMKAEDGYLLATYDKAMYEALCAGELQVLEALARSRLTTKADRRFDNPYYYFFAHALRMLILRKVDPAVKLVTSFDKFRGTAAEGYSRIANAIIRRDSALFNEGFELALEERKAEIQRDDNVFVGEQWLSVELLALARLGRAYGMKLEVTDRLVPQELQGTVDLVYPDPLAVLPPIPDRFTEVPEEPVPSDGE